MNSEKAPTTGFDFGMAGVLGVFVAVLVAIVWLLSSLGDATDESDQEQPVARRVQRDDGALEAQLESARRELSRLRIEQAASPPGTWSDVIEAKRQEIAELTGKLSGN